MTIKPSVKYNIYLVLICLILASCFASPALASYQKAGEETPVFENTAKFSAPKDIVTKSSNMWGPKIGYDYSGKSGTIAWMDETDDDSTYTTKKINKCTYTETIGCAYLLSDDSIPPKWETSAKNIAVGQGTFSNKAKVAGRDMFTFDQIYGTHKGADTNDGDDDPKNNLSDAWVYHRFWDFCIDKPGNTLFTGHQATWQDCDGSEFSFEIIKTGEIAVNNPISTITFNPISPVNLSSGAYIQGEKGQNEDDILETTYFHQYDTNEWKETFSSSSQHYSFGNDFQNDIARFSGPAMAESKLGDKVYLWQYRPKNNKHDKCNGDWKIMCSIKAANGNVFPSGDNTIVLAEDALYPQVDIDGSGNAHIAYIQNGNEVWITHIEASKLNEIATAVTNNKYYNGDTSNITSKGKLISPSALNGSTAQILANNQEDYYLFFISNSNQLIGTINGKGPIVLADNVDSSYYHTAIDKEHNLIHLIYKKSDTIITYCCYDTKLAQQGNKIDINVPDIKDPYLMIDDSYNAHLVYTTTNGSTYSIQYIYLDNTAPKPASNFIINETSYPTFPNWVNDGTYKLEWEKGSDIFSKVNYKIDIIDDKDKPIKSLSTEALVDDSIKGQDLGVDGSYTIFLTTYDQAGNYAESEPILISKDSAEPYVKITSHADNDYISKFFTLKFTAIDNLGKLNSGVKEKWIELAWQNKNNGQWRTFKRIDELVGHEVIQTDNAEKGECSANINLNEIMIAGQKIEFKEGDLIQVKVCAKDNAENTGEDIVELRLTGNKPSVTIITPLVNTEVGNTFEVRSQAEDALCGIDNDSVKVTVSYKDDAGKVQTIEEYGQAANDNVYITNFSIPDLDNNLKPDIKAGQTIVIFATAKNKAGLESGALAKAIEDKTGPKIDLQLSTDNTPDPRLDIKIKDAFYNIRQGNITITDATSKAEIVNEPLIKDQNINEFNCIKSLTDYSPLPGTYDLLITTSDMLDNKSKATVAYQVALDNAKLPSISIASPINNTCISPTLNSVQWTASTPYGFDKYQLGIYQDNTLLKSYNILEEAQTTYNPEYAFVSGQSYLLSLSVFDKAGNKATAVSNVIYDAEAPIILDNAPKIITKGATYEAIFNFTVSDKLSGIKDISIDIKYGKDFPNDKTLKSVPGYPNVQDVPEDYSLVTKDTLYPYTHTADLSEKGTYDYIITLSDDVGNINTITGSFTLVTPLSQDKTSPIISDVKLNNESIENGAIKNCLQLPASISGTIDEANLKEVVLKLDDKQINSSNTVNFYFPLADLSNGTHNIKIIAYDLANNEPAEFTLTLNVNTLPQPTGLKITKENDNYNLSWIGTLDPAKNQLFKLYRSSDNVNWEPVTTLDTNSYFIPNNSQPLAGNANYYNVSIVDKAAESKTSNTAVLWHQLLNLNTLNAMVWPAIINENLDTLGEIAEDIKLLIPLANGEILQINYKPKSGNIEDEKEYLCVVDGSNNWINHDEVYANIKVNSGDSLEIGTTKTINWYFGGIIQ